MKKNILFVGYGDELLDLIKVFKTNKNINIVGLILRTDLKEKERNIFLKKIQKLKIKHFNACSVIIYQVFFEILL